MPEFQGQFLVNLAVTFVVVTCLLGTHAQPPSTSSPVSGPTTAKSNCTLDSTVSFSNMSNMTSAQKSNAVTMEFKLKDGQKGDDLNMMRYCEIRQAILKELNRRHRRNRTKSMTSTAMPSTTEPSTTVATTVAPTTKMTTPSTTTASTITTMTTTEPTTTSSTTEAPTTTPPTTVTTVTTTTPFPRIPDVKRKRKRRESDNEDEPDFYTEDDLNFVLVEPLVVDGVARMSLFLSKYGVEIDPDLLFNATKTVNGTGELEEKADMPVTRIYRGLPEEVSATGTLIAAAGLDFRFLLALLLIIICFIVILVAIVCVRRQHSEPEHEQLIEVPGSFSPVNELPNDVPYVPNGTRHIPDDDGYIVPYHEMLAARRDKLSVETYPEQSRL